LGIRGAGGGGDLHLFVASELLGGFFPTESHAVADKQRIKVDHDHASIRFDTRENAVWHVAGVIAQRTRAAVAEHNGRLGDIEDVAHDLLRHVAEVHKHT
jgi:hypothetical protein